LNSKTDESCGEEVLLIVTVYESLKETRMTPACFLALKEKEIKFSFERNIMKILN